MTSNIGADLLLDSIQTHGIIDQDTKNQVLDHLRQSFRPEFLNRIDEVVLFNPLTKKDLYQIVNLLIKDLEGRLKDRGMSIKVSNEAVEHMIQEGYEPKYGARPLKRYIQRHLETLLGRTIIQEQLTKDVVFYVDVKDRELVIKSESEVL